jgi:RNA polymerase sigma-70 factor (ECF subfamily)
VDSLENHPAISEQLTSDVFFDGNEAQVRLVAALRTLPDKQRAVFNMCYFDDMPYAQISEVTGTSVGALKASYHHAAKKVESFLKEAMI